MLENARLESLSEKDLDLILQWRNQDFIRKSMFNSEVISKDEHYKWFKNNERNGNSIMKLFLYNETPYGFIQFKFINIEEQICEWSFYIGQENAPKGIGTLMGFTALNFIFKEQKIRKLIAHVIEDNKKSYNYHLKLGFKEEGYIKKQFIKDNAYQNIYLFTQLDKQWENKSSQLKYDFN